MIDKFETITDPSERPSNSTYVYALIFFSSALTSLIWFSKDLNVLNEHTLSLQLLGSALPLSTVCMLVWNIPPCLRPQFFEPTLQILDTSIEVKKGDKI